MTQNVLVVDDDPVMVSLLRHVLTKAGYVCITASHVDEARRLAARQRPHAAIVDVALGSESGLDLVRLWRVVDAFPVILLSSLGEPIDRIIGLEVGAYDYVVKPFEPREFLLRLKIALDRKALRMPRYEDMPRWSLGKGTFDARQRRLRVGEREIELTTAEFNFLQLLVTHPNEVLTRDRIMDEVHSRERMATDRSVDMMVGRLRKKVAEVAVSIEAIRGAGYMLCGPVERL